MSLTNRLIDGAVSICKISPLHRFNIYSSERVSMKESDKEKIKLQANYWNAMAVSVFAVGGLSTVITFTLNRPNEKYFSLIIFVAAMITSYTIHLISRSYLNKIDKN